jgi:7-cyano-7-deazaguanine synthase
MSDLAVVLVSGGMDSAVVASIASQAHRELAFLHLNYGQKTNKKEFSCYQKLADHFQVKIRKEINMNFLNEIGGSSLTDENISVSNYQGDSDEIPSSYVPFRNTHILSLAVSWAEIIGAKNIYIGANYEDSTGYPDCRPEYYQAFNDLIKKGSRDGDIKVQTPVIMMTKKRLLRKALL